IRTMGPRGLKQASEDAVINANYLMRKLSKHYELPYPVHCKHEFVLSGSKQKKLGVRTLDVAKRLLDYGYHPPTIYFPLNVEEEPEIVQEAPHETIVGRMDETLAARKPVLRYQKDS